MARVPVILDLVRKRTGCYHVVVYDEKHRLQNCLCKLVQVSRFKTLNADCLEIIHSVAFSQFFCSQDPDYRKMAVVEAHSRQTSVALTPKL